MNPCPDLWQILMTIDLHPFHLVQYKLYYCVWVSRSRWLCGLRRRSEAAWLLGSWVRIPLRAGMFVSCVCCVDRGLCDELVTRDLETATMRRPGLELGFWATERKNSPTLSLSGTNLLYFAQDDVLPLRYYQGTYKSGEQVVVLVVIHLQLKDL